MKQYQADISLNREQRCLLFYVICVKKIYHRFHEKTFLSCFSGFAVVFLIRPFLSSLLVNITTYSST